MGRPVMDNTAQCVQCPSPGWALEVARQAVEETLDLDRRPQTSNEMPFTRGEGESRNEDAVASHAEPTERGFVIKYTAPRVGSR